MTPTLDRGTIDAARQRAQDDLRPYLTHRAAWMPESHPAGVVAYAADMGWRWFWHAPSGAHLFVREGLSLPRFRLAECVEGDVTFFGFPTEHDRERGIKVLSDWHEMVAR